MSCKEKEINGGVQKLYKFKNGYGASVVRHTFSYGSDQGLWELAVLEYHGENWEICYHTPITSDVIGYLNQEQVDDLLNKIKNLSRWQVWWNKNLSMKEGYPVSKLKSFWENVKDYYYDRILSKFR